MEPANRSVVIRLLNSLRKESCKLLPAVASRLSHVSKKILGVSYTHISINRAH